MSSDKMLIAAKGLSFCLTLDCHQGHVNLFEPKDKFPLELRFTQCVCVSVCVIIVSISWNHCICMYVACVCVRECGLLACVRCKNFLEMSVIFVFKGFEVMP